MARQGQAFATADEARIVYTDSGEHLRDVPADGKTVGERLLHYRLAKRVKASTLQVS